MKLIFKREPVAFLAAAAVLGGILAGATHYLTPQQHDYGSVWGMYEQEQTDSIDVLFFGSSVAQRRQYLQAPGGRFCRCPH